MTEVLGAYYTLLSSIAGHDFQQPGGGPESTYNLVPSLASYKNGTNHALTSLEVDSRYDVQRRRENALASSRITQSF